MVVEKKKGEVLFGAFLFRFGYLVLGSLGRIGPWHSLALALPLTFLFLFFFFPSLSLPEI
jgi:hypothetical protein